MQILIDNDFFKQIRIVDGVLVNIIKYKTINRIWSNLNLRKELSKISEGLYQSKVDKEERGEIICSKGDYIIKPYNSAGYYVIEKEKADKWSYEIKTTGSSFSGDKSTIYMIIKDINIVINQELKNN